MFATGGTAQSTTAAQAQYAPQNSALPTVSGTPQDNQTLSAKPGNWTSSTDVNFSYQWQRCNSSGASCANIASANKQEYEVTSQDVGDRLRVVVSARNKDGTTNAISAPTDVVKAKNGSGGGNGPLPAGAVKESNGRISVPASSVALPARLIIEKVAFDPSPVKSRTTINGRFHIVDTRGYDVRDALVYAIGLPYSRVQGAPEVKSGQDGWASIAFQPAKFFPRKGYITFFVRARNQSGDPLAGSSTRRLVQVTISR
ncbi:MAG TPA: hypothetical protein VFI37_03030 [Gaiellaceae bacterium]|nr:hypothetical protein [Gaiellaceae bacterium]